MEPYKKPRDGPLDLSTALHIVVVETVKDYLDNGGPEVARTELKRMSITFRKNKAWPQACCDAEALINQHLMKQQQQQLQDLSNMLLSMMAASQKLVASQPPPAAPPPNTQHPTPRSAQRDACQSKNTQHPTPNLSVSHICWSLKTLQAEEYKNGKPLFTQANHWQAVFRILVDQGMFRDNDYDGFDEWMRNNIPKELSTNYNKNSVKNISQTLYNKPLERWTYDPALEKTRQPFERMQTIAKRFQELLFLPDGLPAT